MVFCSVAFAASPTFIEIPGFKDTALTGSYVVEWQNGRNVMGEPVPEASYGSGGYPLFSSSIPYHVHQTTGFLSISQPAIFLPIDSYDVYYVTVVRSLSSLTPDYYHEFSFFPVEANLITTDENHSSIDALSVQKLIHTDVESLYVDNALMLGFTAVWKIPNTLKNNGVSSVEFLSGDNSSMINGNTVFNNYFVYVPSGAAAAESAQAIVDAIDDQTAGITGALADQTDQLMAVPDEQVQAAEQFVNDSNAQLQEALSPLMAAEQLSGSLVNAFRSKEKYQVYFPGVAGPFMPDGSTVTIIQPQTVDMSFMDRFSIITDAIGVVMLGLCGWKTLDFLYNTLMKILGKEGDES